MIYLFLPTKFLETGPTPSKNHSWLCSFRDNDALTHAFSYYLYSNSSKQDKDGRMRAPMQQTETNALPTKLNSTVRNSTGISCLLVAVPRILSRYLLIVFVKTCIFMINSFLITTMKRHLSRNRLIVMLNGEYCVFCW